MASASSPKKQDNWRVSRLAGETVTDAVTRAMCERLERLRAEQEAQCDLAARGQTFVRQHAHLFDRHPVSKEEWDEYGRRCARTAGPAELMAPDLSAVIAILFDETEGPDCIKALEVPATNEPQGKQGSHQAARGKVMALSEPAGPNVILHELPDRQKKSGSTPNLFDGHLVQPPHETDGPACAASGDE